MRCVVVEEVGVCVCVLTSGSEGLPYYAISIARLIHPPQCLRCHIPPRLLNQPLPGEMLADGCLLGRRR
jgi:hypothetical protein